MSFFPKIRRGAVIALGALAIAGCNSESSTEPTPATPLEQQVWASALAIDLATFTKLPSGVYIKELTTGAGATATASSSISAFYTLWLPNGTQIQSNVGGTVIGPASLSGFIQGWQLGIPGMKVGGKRRLLIPAALGYGAQGSGNIPPNTNLVFDVTLQSAQ